MTQFSFCAHYCDSWSSVDWVSGTCDRRISKKFLHEEMPIILYVHLKYYICILYYICIISLFKQRNKSKLKKKKSPVGYLLWSFFLNDDIM